MMAAATFENLLTPRRHVLRFHDNRTPKELGDVLTVRLEMFQGCSAGGRDCVRVAHAWDSDARPPPLQQTPLYLTCGSHDTASSKVENLLHGGLDPVRI